MTLLLLRFHMGQDGARQGEKEPAVPKERRLEM